MPQPYAVGANGGDFWMRKHPMFEVPKPEHNWSWWVAIIHIFINPYQSHSFHVEGGYMFMNLFEHSLSLFNAHGFA